MTIENSTTKTFTLTAEQYANVLLASNFLCSFVDLIDDSGLDIPTDLITPILANVSIDLRNLLRGVE